MTLAVVLALCSCGDDTNGPPTDYPESSGNLIEACIKSTACSNNPYPRVSDCVNNYRNRLADLKLTAIFDGIYRCTNVAQSCAEVGACFGAGEACTRDFKASCDGGNAVYCDLLDDRTYRYNCTATGQSCRVDPLNPFDAKCSGAPTPRWQPVSLSPNCTGGRCSITQETCTSDQLNSCSESRLRACVDGRWVDFDCAGLGLGACRVMPNGWARCAAPAQ